MQRHYAVSFWKKNFHSAKCHEVFEWSATYTHQSAAVRPLIGSDYSVIRDHLELVQHSTNCTHMRWHLLDRRRLWRAAVSSRSRKDSTDIQQIRTWWMTPRWRVRKKRNSDAVADHRHTSANDSRHHPADTLQSGEWQWQRKVVRTVQQHCWIRRTCDYLVECSLLRAV